MLETRINFLLISMMLLSACGGRTQELEQQLNEYRAQANYFYQQHQFALQQLNMCSADVDSLYRENQNFRRMLEQSEGPIILPPRRIQ